MAKGKSSASSATRKKHAKKAAGDNADEVKPQQPAQRGQKKDKKRSRFEPKVKSYIPPPPPPKGIPDPVDVYLAAGKDVNPELAVILRKLAKKDEATIEKGIEGFSGWVEQLLKDERELAPDDEDTWKIEARREEVLKTLPVWVNHFPRLALHSTRKVRFEAHTFHSTFLGQATSSSQTLQELRDALLLQWIEQPDFLGAWCLSTFDADKAIRALADRSWKQLVKPQLQSSPDAPVPAHVTLEEHAEAVWNSATSYFANSGDPFVQSQAILAVAYLVRTEPKAAITEEQKGFVTSEELWNPLKDAGPANVKEALLDLLESISKDRSEELLLDGEDGEALKMVASRVLANCWSLRSGWPGVIEFLRRYPQAWQLADEVQASSGHASDENSDSDNENDDEKVEERTPATNPQETAASSGRSPSLAGFYQHLTLGCTGSPSLYPTIILLLSVTPSTILPPTSSELSLLFESFWAALDGRALSVGNEANLMPSAPIHEFTRAFLECLLWEVAKNGEEDPTLVADLAAEWFGRLLEAYLGKDGKAGKLGTRIVADAWVNSLSKLSESSAGAFAPTWDVATRQVAAVLAAPTVVSLRALSTLLARLVRASSPAVRSVSQELVDQTLRTTCASIAADPTSATCAAHLELVEALEKLLPRDSTSRSELQIFCLQTLPRVFPTTVAASTALLKGLFRGSTGEGKGQVWEALLKAALPVPVLLQIAAALRSDLAIAGGGLVSEALDGQAPELARIAFEADGSTPALELLKAAVRYSHAFISSSVLDEIIVLASSRLCSLTERMLLREAATSAFVLQDFLPGLLAPAELLATLVADRAHAQLLLKSPLGVECAVALFEVSELVPQLAVAQDVAGDLDTTCVAPARVAWKELLAINEVAMTEAATSRLKRLLPDVLATPSPVDLVEAFRALPSLSTNPPRISSIVPTSQQISDLISAASNPATPWSLSIIDPVIVRSDASTSSQPAQPAMFDTEGFTALSRSVVAVLDWCKREPRAGSATEYLPALLEYSILASDEEAVQGSTLALLCPEGARDLLKSLHKASVGLVAFSLSTASNALPESWHRDVIAQIKSTSKVTTGGLGDVLLSLYGNAGENRTVGRAFVRVLQAALRYSDDDKANAEAWLVLARSLPDADVRKLYIVYGIRDSLSESDKFDRYRNELASNITGVKPSAASTTGLSMLRLLLSTAPPEDSTVAFLPQQRAVFLIQHLQRWISSDEDIADAVLSGLAELFLHLAPIIQNLVGQHWDFLFDVVETNLDMADWLKDEGLPPLSHAVKLVSRVTELATFNSELRKEIGPRLKEIRELVRDKFFAITAQPKIHEPAAVVSVAMIRLIMSLPDQMLASGDVFDQLVKFFSHTSATIRLASFELASKWIDHFVQEMVVKAELDQLEPELPAALLSAISVTTSTAELDFRQVSGVLLSWLAVFEFFRHSSPRLRSSYITQLRRADVVESALIPLLFGVLHINDRERPVDLAPWAVDEFRLDSIVDTDGLVLSSFATNVYYRSLQHIPGLVRAWWDACKNKQLSMTVSSFTSKHFSPVLISRELAHLRDPEDPVGKSLRDNDDFTVKVSGTTNEVKAVYVVDEQNMEIGVRLPPEYPLYGVEVKDIRKIGVSDAQWRAWLLAVQQVLTAQSGLIADALSLFKRNVTLHFEGVEPCAICYSVISVVDRSLPTKSCRTCSNKFHAGCLYKWFQTSHGTSCPLCRSTF